MSVFSRSCKTIKETVVFTKRYGLWLLAKESKVNTSTRILIICDAFYCSSEAQRVESKQTNQEFRCQPGTCCVS